jgi:aminobenzoyl-glutamate transport protein
MKAIAEPRLHKLLAQTIMPQKGYCMNEQSDTRQSGFLAFVEKWGNKLPEPAMLFVWLIGFLMLLSALGAWLGWSASLPFSGETAPAFATLENGFATFRAESLFSEANIRRLFTEMPRTFTGFAPLGIALTIMMSAAVAERSGLLSALIRGSLRDVPRRLLTPAVVLVGMLSHHASDAAYMVYIPLVALLYAIVGRHPLAGLAAAFAAVAGGHSGNLFPGQFDIIMLSFTQEAARIVDPTWTMNPLGNWWFILGMVVVFTPIIWFLTDRVVEPRLGSWGGSADPALRDELARAELTADERRGLRRAGVAFGIVVGAALALAYWPGFTPLLDSAATGIDRLKPLFGSIIALFALLFVATGAAFGTATGTVKSDRDVVAMLVEGMRAMAPYIVFAFFAAHFVAMFNWSRLGPIIAIQGAGVLEALQLPAAVLLVSVLLFSSFLDLFIGSATAKWSALAPVVVPMFMLVGISPEMTTAAYRMGDSVTNIMTPLMGYFPLILGFARRWDPRFGVGSLLALMLPYGLSFLVAGVAMVAAWAAFEVPLGPGAPVTWERPHAG